MTPTQGLLDTNILILRAGIDPDEPPDEMTISAITTAELPVGVLVASGPQELAHRMTPATQRTSRAWIICSQWFRSLDHSRTAPETCLRPQESNRNPGGEKGP
ncbi:hypothetical protein GCM10027612_08830 [Microbispora bryophytorum subsp. camponoti]